ncbi:hypothetical protein KI688_009954 [Linnemannia hyalina]|uniref:Coilin n=1 Tax=Linnemannia hyalina TaxID=64524 RepID=A0A9P7XYM3_9FUNG|nr:hypothetical protein KI688_009954 [Linnemannia hyalina]
MRIRLTFEDPLPAYKCWYEVPASCSTIHDLQRVVRKGFNLDQYCKTTRLDLDGFFLLPASTIAGSLKDGDLLQVMIRKKGDGLPPRHLPVSGGKKRSSEDAGLSNTADRKASKKMKSTPPNKKPTAPLVKQHNIQVQQSGQGQQKQQPNAQNNKKKNQQNNKKAKQNNSNNNKPQQNSQQLPSKDNVQAKANKKNKNNNQKNNKGDAASNTNTNNNTKTNTSGQNSKGAETNGTKRSKNNRTVNVDLDQSVNERRNVRFAPESTSQPKKVAMSSSSSSGSSSDSSSSSDTSNSNKDSSDSSDSDSNSSDSDSDSDSSSSESDSNKKDEKKAAVTRIVPGMGMGATKSRNARRKLLKMKLAEAREEAVSGSDTSGNPLKRHTVAVTQLVDATPATPPVRTSGKAAPQANGKDSAHNNNKIPSPQANRKAPTQASTPPKVIMTSVDLKDSELITKTTPKRVTRSTQKKPNGTAQEVPETPQPETGVKQKDSGSKKTVPAEKESDDPSEVDVTPRDYHSLPKSEDSLAIGDVIAFKTLEMGPSYQPIISDFKEATVLSYSTTDMTAEVQLARKFRTPVQLDDDGNPILGKFDIYDEEEVERARRGIVSFDILGLADCRIISKR